jgi:hypothetical protein
VFKPFSVQAQKKKVSIFLHLLHDPAVGALEGREEPVHREFLQVLDFEDRYIVVLVIIAIVYGGFIVSSHVFEGFPFEDRCTVSTVLLDFFGDLFDHRFAHDDEFHMVIEVGVGLVCDNGLGEFGHVDSAVGCLRVYTEKGLYSLNGFRPCAARQFFFIRETQIGPRFMSNREPRPTLSTVQCIDFLLR